jgi:hypothetical protein
MEPLNRLRTSTQRLMRIAPLLAMPAALLLSTGRAEAALTYSIFELGGNVVVETNGSLNLSGSIGTGQCGANGLINSSIAAICTGPDGFGSLTAYTITGPSGLNASVNIFPASSVSGIGTFLDGNLSRFSIDSSYINNSPIVSSATFNTTTLAALGFNTTGTLGTWSLNGTGDTINVEVVPGPLPIFGAAAAFGWSRRLRRRIAISKTTEPG